MRLNEAGGSVGGILVLWDNKVLELFDMEVGVFSIPLSI